MQNRTIWNMLSLEIDSLFVTHPRLYWSTILGSSKKIVPHSIHQLQQEAAFPYEMATVTGWQISRFRVPHNHLGRCQNLNTNILGGWTPINPSFFDVHHCLSKLILESQKAEPEHGHPRYGAWLSCTQKIAWSNHDYGYPLVNIQFWALENHHLYIIGKST